MNEFCTLSQSYSERQSCQYTLKALVNQSVWGEDEVYMCPWCGHWTQFSLARPKDWLTYWTKYRMQYNLEIDHLLTTVVTNLPTIVPSHGWDHRCLHITGRLLQVLIYLTTNLQCNESQGSHLLQFSWTSESANVYKEMLLRSLVQQ